DLTVLRFHLAGFEPCVAGIAVSGFHVADLRGHRHFDLKAGRAKISSGNDIRGGLIDFPHWVGHSFGTRRYWNGFNPAALAALADQLESFRNFALNPDAEFYFTGCRTGVARFDDQTCPIEWIDFSKGK